MKKRKNKNRKALIKRIESITIPNMDRMTAFKICEQSIPKEQFVSWGWFKRLWQECHNHNKGEE